MNVQAELELMERPRVRVPTAPKTLTILKALDRGERLTVADALRRYDVYALSQEIGRLRKLGWKIEDKTVETSPGTFVKEYWKL